MTLLSILITLVMVGLIGFVVYLVTEYIPMPAAFKQVIIVACVVLLVLYLIAVVVNSGGVLVPRLR